MVKHKAKKGGMECQGWERGCSLKKNGLEDLTEQVISELRFEGGEREPGRGKGSLCVLTGRACLPGGRLCHPAAGLAPSPSTYFSVAWKNI